MRDVTQIPLYFLPGTQCDEQLWQQVFELLPKHFIPHAITLPHGNTPLEIVHALHKKLMTIQHNVSSHHVEPINLIGFSLGGYLAALYSVTYPEHLQKLLILANAPRPLPNDELILREQTLAYIKTHGYKGMPRKRIEQLLADVNTNNIEIINIISSMDKRAGQAMLEQQLAKTSHREHLIPQLVSMPFDIIFVIGEQDNLVNFEQLTKEIEAGLEKIISEALSSNKPLNELVYSNISLDLIKNCGHMSPLESPQAVANHIITFFDNPRSVKTDLGIV